MSDEQKPQPLVPEVVEQPAPKKTRHRRVPKNHPYRGLTTRQAAFVQHAANGREPLEAAKAAGYSITSLSDQGTKNNMKSLMQNPKVLNALAYAIQQQCPDIESKLANKLSSLLDLPVKTHRSDEGISVNELLSVGEFFKDVFGWSSPKQTQHLRADVSKLLLPKK